MASKKERVELEMKIMKYRELARNAPDEVTRQRISILVSELEQKLRESDEQGPGTVRGQSGPSANGSPLSGLTPSERLAGASSVHWWTPGSARFCPRFSPL